MCRASVTVPIVGRMPETPKTLEKPGKSRIQRGTLNHPAENLFLFEKKFTEDVQSLREILFPHTHPKVVSGILEE